MVKFPGLFSQIGFPELLHESWPEASEHLIGLITSRHQHFLQDTRRRQKEELDKHWLRIAEVFKGEADLTQYAGPVPGVGEADYRGRLLSLAVGKLGQDVDKRDTRIAALQEALGDRDLATREATERSTGGMAQLEMRHAEIRELSERLSAERGRAAELDQALENADAKVHELLVTRIRRDAVRQKLGEEVRAREAHIGRLLAELRSKIGHLKELEATVETQQAR